MYREETISCFPTLGKKALIGSLEFTKYFFYLGSGEKNFVIRIMRSFDIIMNWVTGGLAFMPLSENQWMVFSQSISKRK